MKAESFVLIKYDLPILFLFSIVLKINVSQIDYPLSLPILLTDGTHKGGVMGHKR